MRGLSMFARMYDTHTNAVNASFSTQIYYVEDPAPLWSNHTMAKPKAGGLLFLNNLIDFSLGPKLFKGY